MIYFYGRKKYGRKLYEKIYFLECKRNKGGYEQGFYDGVQQP